MLTKRRLLSGIIFVNRNGLHWLDAPAAYGPHKTQFKRWKRWSEAGVFIRMMEGLFAAQAERGAVLIDATISRHAARLRACGRRKGCMNTNPCNAPRGPRSCV